MTEAPFDDLILKFLSREITQEEEERLLKWVNETQDNKKQFDDLQKLWKISDKTIPRIDFQTDKEWQRLETFLNEENTGKHRQLNEDKKSDLSKNLTMKIAASVILMVVSSIVIYFMGIKSVDEIVITSGDKRINVTLADGSQVWLNEQSQLTYPEKFDGNEREVKLTGEAFFDVERNVEKPFIIYAGEASVRVLGTSFNVDAYKEDTLLKVSVATGKVKLSESRGNEAMIIEPGATGSLNKTSHTLFFEKEENINAFAWKSRKLIFKKTKLSKVLEVLNDYYKVKIMVKNPSLLNCRFTSSFDDAKIAEVIESLSISLNLTILHQDNGYLLDGEGCN